MSELRLEKLQITAAGFGTEKNPFPSLHTLKVNAMLPTVKENISKEESKYFGYGFIQNCLPYRLQDNYDRNRKPRDFKVAVLENEIFKVTFLLEFGGRLWSLIHKPSGRELLYKNPVFQPANLAIRNAWFSGGVEWNMGIPGHNPFTCSSPFFATLNDDGTPVLRMYEWERIRNAPYQVDFYLPDNSPLLMVRVKLINPNSFEVPAYWWSNIAIPESDDLRVLAPTDYGYFGHLDPQCAYVEKMNFPFFREKNISYPTNNVSAHDYFLPIPKGQRPWEAALGGNGKGLVHVSTSLMKGRKLFVWGTSSGGNRWKDYLSEPGNPYVEIQGGIINTQFECMPMAPESELTWLEGYGMINADPDKAHGDDWKIACGEVESNIEKLATQDFLEKELLRTEKMSNTAPDKIIQKGTGWGELEIKRRSIAGDPFVNNAMVFEDSLSPNQQPWLNLLTDGHLPEQPTEKAPGGFITQNEWLQLLEGSTATQKGDN